ncbi:cyclic nucleotide-binding domain-containing protein [Emticicia sp. CRIBPO]|uniref:Crp/Fnr family transcriptional regulator n=1 Tax=Emticicia sp. CRIBPO TaxID=2683258 RepID=UPI001412FF5C|nr:Crp/Fnr family transcriptional regulator [Emticicia sp. CRIBPO]NBA84644.1 cyclic nucleotide-binding domain-containing protein [Emticicia sp. CRIBPO]
MEELIQITRQLWPSMCPEFEDTLRNSIVREIIPKKQLVLKEGQTAHHMYFVEQGCLRGYYLREGNEINSWFMKEGDFVISIISFYTQMPTEEMIETLEDCVLWSISYDQLNELYFQYPEFNQVGRLLTERYYVLSEQRTQNLRKKTADERYRHLVTSFPDISNRVPLKFIASYLGISFETLSRLRAKKW